MAVGVTAPNQLIEIRQKRAEPVVRYTLHRGRLSKVDTKRLSLVVAVTMNETLALARHMYPIRAAKEFRQRVRGARKRNGRVDK